MTDSIWGHAGKKENMMDFKAGQLFRRGRMIHADPQKGRVIVYHDPNRILHVKWMTRPGGKTKPEEDLLVLPGDCKFIRIEQVKDGRVFVLEFQSGKERFFWLQEPTTDDDEEIFEKLGKVIDNPGAEVKMKDGQDTLMKGYRDKHKENAEKKKRDEEKKSGMLNKDSFNSAFSDAIKDFFPTDPNKVDISFNDVLHSRRMEDLLIKDPSICEFVVSFLPEGTPATPTGIMKHIRSPQFRQAADLINDALSSGQVEGRTLGFDCGPGARTVDSICKKMIQKNDKMEDEQ